MNSVTFGPKPVKARKARHTQAGEFAVVVAAVFAVVACAVAWVSMAATTARLLGLL